MISLSEEHRDHLLEQKAKYNLSYAAQIRSLITQRIERDTVTISDSYTMTRSRTVTRRVSPQDKTVKSINAELSTNPLFIKMKERNR